MVRARTVRMKVADVINYIRLINSEVQLCYYENQRHRCRDVLFFSCDPLLNMVIPTIMDLFHTHTYKETHLLGTGGLNLTPGLVTQTKENPSRSHEIIKR